MTLKSVELRTLDGARGNNVGKALGTLTALQVLFASDESDQPGLASRLVASLTSKATLEQVGCGRLSVEPSLLLKLQSMAASTASA